MAILACWQPATAATTKLFSPTLCNDTKHEVFWEPFAANLILLARPIVGSPNNAALALVTTAASRLLLMQSQLQFFPRWKALIAIETMDVPIHLPFNVTINSFTGIPWHLQKRMLVSNANIALPTIYSCRRIRPSSVAIGTHKERKFKVSVTETVTPYSSQTVAAIHYKASVDSAKQIARHANVQDENTDDFARGWQ